MSAQNSVPVRTTASGSADPVITPVPVPATAILKFSLNTLNQHQRVLSDILKNTANYSRKDFFMLLVDHLTNVQEEVNKMTAVIEHIEDKVPKGIKTITAEQAPKDKKINGAEVEDRGTRSQRRRLRYRRIGVKLAERFQMQASVDEQQPFRRPA